MTSEAQGCKFIFKSLCLNPSHVIFGFLSLCFPSYHMFFTCVHVFFVVGAKGGVQNDQGNGVCIYLSSCFCLCVLAFLLQVFQNGYIPLLASWCCHFFKTIHFFFSCSSWCCIFQDDHIPLRLAFWCGCYFKMVHFLF